MNRRRFLQTSLAAMLAAVPAMAQTGRRPRILLRNGWQSQNIGDIAHYMGMMELLKRHQIDADVRFWASNMENGADELFHKHFPTVPCFKDKPSVDAAFKECDFFLHGSSLRLRRVEGCHALARRDRQAIRRHGDLAHRHGRALLATLRKANFVTSATVCRPRRAQEELGIPAPPAMGWGRTRPLASSSCATKRRPPRISGRTASSKAGSFAASRAIAGRRSGRSTRIVRWTQVKLARNREMVEHDHAPHREAIIRLVREAGVKVLVTHEDQTQIHLGKEVLFDPLPDDVKRHVVWRESYWLTDEALSVYARSLGLFGNEMHSPILCIANGIPAAVGRWDEQTQKGFMWRDIGLDEWLFTMDDEERIRAIPQTVLAIASDPAAAKAKVEKGRQIVLAKQAEQFASLRKALA
jgi:hypothetical protein